MSFYNSPSTIVVNFTRRNSMIKYTPFSVEIHFSLRDDSQAVILAKRTEEDANRLLNPNGFALVLKGEMNMFIGRGFLFEFVKKGNVGKPSTFIASQFTCMFQKIFGQFNFKLVNLSEFSTTTPNNANYVYKRGGTITFIKEQEPEPEAQAVPVPFLS